MYIHIHICVCVYGHMYEYTHYDGMMGEKGKSDV